MKFVSPYLFDSLKFFTINEGGPCDGGIDFGGLGFNQGQVPSIDIGDDWRFGSYGSGYLEQNMGPERSFLVDEWNFLEFHILLNTVGMSDGVLEVWLDNCGTDGSACSGTPTKVIERTDVVWRDTSMEMTTFWKENWSNPPSSGNSLIDNLVISTAGPIGFFGVTPNPPPAAPTGLQISG